MTTNNLPNEFSERDFQAKWTKALLTFHPEFSNSLKALSAMEGDKVVCPSCLRAGGVRCLPSPHPMHDKFKCKLCGEEFHVSC